MNYYRVKEERNRLHRIKRRKANWSVHILRRIWLLKHVIEGKIEEKVGRGRRRKQLLDGVKERKEYLKSKKEELDRTA